MLDEIRFHQSHLPALIAADYEIAVEQEVKDDAKSVQDLKIASENTFSVTRTFSVRGPRFALKPEDVQAVFPPAGSLGDHSNVLPHIALNRSTLPWERLAAPEDKKTPWLALLLFYNEEAPEPKIVSLKDLGAGPAKFPGIAPERGQSNDDKVAVIDVQRNVLEKIMPGSEELVLLAHVRESADYVITDQTLDALKAEVPGDVLSKLANLKGREFTGSNAFLDALKNEIGDQQTASHQEAIAKRAADPVETAVVICNRLPRPSGVSVAHLVSVEGRYNANGFDYQGAGSDELIRLVSLRSWSFACIDHQQSFMGLLARLNCSPSVLRLPDCNDATANKCLGAGSAPLWHELRQGGRTVSWYHGPLAPAENILEENAASAPDLPARAADELIRYNPATGMFDISYSAAWELGRLLALQSKTFSVSLYNWKRAHAQQLRQIEESLLRASPLDDGNAQEPLPVPPEIADWFRRLSLLEGAPFTYLVPDERMLPLESIRFFQVDWLWVECLLDGAFSIGRVTSADHRRDARRDESPAARPHAEVSGLLMRSEVVSGWPGLLVDGFNGDKKLGLLRMDRLSANVLLCLFAGKVTAVDIHLRPEMAHFGLDEEDASGFHKKLRDGQGDKTDAARTAPVTFRQASTRTVDISALAKAISGGGALTSAQFALQMIETSPRARFALRS